MDILIKGMTMPESCAKCPLLSNCSECEGIHNWCMPLGVDNGYTDYPENDLTPTDKRRDDCPLVPVPSHGRLIDADALMKEFENAQRTMEQHGQEYSCSFLSSSQEISTEWYCVEDMLDNAPTVIEAEEGK